MTIFLIFSCWWYSKLFLFFFFSFFAYIVPLWNILKNSLIGCFNRKVVWLNQRINETTFDGTVDNEIFMCIVPPPHFSIISVWHIANAHGCRNRDIENKIKTFFFCTNTFTMEQYQLTLCVFLEGANLRGFSSYPRVRVSKHDAPVHWGFVPQMIPALRS